MWSFGWPLLLNSFVMFVSQQADQLLIARFFSLEVLAPYALALSIVAIPWFIFGQVASAVMLPFFARVQEDPSAFRTRYIGCVQLAAAAAVLFTLPIALCGDQFLRLLYGEKYGGYGLVVCLLAVAVMVRFIRFVPALAAMARGDTLNQCYSNVWRAGGFVAALILLTLGCGLLSVAACSIFGEVLAAINSLARLRRIQNIGLADSAASAAYITASAALLLGCVYAGAPL
jgi:O-antigen/teichoic acid export membrane protein